MRTCLRVVHCRSSHRKGTFCFRRDNKNESIVVMVEYLSMASRSMCRWPSHKRKNQLFVLHHHNRLGCIRVYRPWPMQDRIGRMVVPPLLGYLSKSLFGNQIRTYRSAIVIHRILQREQIYYCVRPKHSQTAETGPSRVQIHSLVGEGLPMLNLHRPFVQDPKILEYMSNAGYQCRTSINHSTMTCRCNHQKDRHVNPLQSQHHCSRDNQAFLHSKL
mmetsp:Transcript_21739/g.30662  ORF Transcript_21739/g.30662 Transcript_21739/m.30662 type:complete len:217 (+) Transcript_21739:1044-1694(+)